MADPIQQHVSPRQPPPIPSTAELVDRLMSFDGPPEQYLVYLLAVQCHVSAAEGGTILRRTPDGKTDALAVFPPVEKGQAAPLWVAQAVELVPQALASGATLVKPVHDASEMYGQPAKRHLIFLPIKSATSVRGTAVFLVDTGDPAAIESCRDRLELTLAFLSLYEMRLTLQRNRLDVARMRLAMETLNAVNDQDRFAGAAMALCNEIASRWKCERASLGFLKGRYVQLKALSHTEKFSRKMKLVQDLESAMEECLDQDLEIALPAGEDNPCVTRSAAELSRQHGPSAIVSLPLRRAGKPMAVLTLERPIEQPFTAADAEALRLTTDLATPRLTSLYETDRWAGARLAASMRGALAAVIGPKHTWIKVAAVGVLTAALFLIYAQGAYRATGTFVLETVDKAVVPAPFEGFIVEAARNPGETVSAGDVLARLDTLPLEMHLASLRAEHSSHITQAGIARRDDKIAEARIAEQLAQKIQAEIDLVAHRIEQAAIRSPIAGTVIAGDLRHRLGAPVKTGDALFEVAPLAAMRAEVAVPEDIVADVEVGARGMLATVSRPNVRIPLVVERISPMAELDAKSNVFMVRVRLEETHPWMRPGMEGVAKIEIGRRSYGYLWTRQIVNWVRMKFWL